MELYEADPLPAECQTCTEEDCYNCDYAGARWLIPKEEKLKIKRKSLLRAIARLERQIESIDRELMLIQNGNKNG